MQRHTESSTPRPCSHRELWMDGRHAGCSDGQLNWYGYESTHGSSRTVSTEVINIRHTRLWALTGVSTEVLRGSSPRQSPSLPRTADNMQRTTDTTEQHATDKQTPCNRQRMPCNRRRMGRMLCCVATCCTHRVGLQHAMHRTCWLRLSDRRHRLERPE